MKQKSQSLTMLHGIAGAIALVLCFLTATGRAADDPEILVEASAEEIFVGEHVDMNVEIRNSKNPSPPDMSAIKREFDILSGGDESRNQSSTFILNGIVSEQNVFSHVYHYRLTPKSIGDLTIPSATATIDGKTISSNPLRLRVVAPEKQDIVLVEVKANQQRVYPTQPFTVTLRVLVRPLPKSDANDPLAPLRRRPPHLQINWSDIPAGLTTSDKTQWLQPLLSESGVGFTLNEVATQSASIFFDGQRLAVFNLLKGRETHEGLDGTPVKYYVYELARVFTPEKTGNYQFGPGIVKGTFVADFNGSEYTAKRLVAIAPAVSVEVREVPTPRPPTYCGGIGSYKVAATASPTKLRVGDPLTLTVELERGDQSGSLQLISAPDLSAIPDVVANFDLIDKNPTGRIEGAVKKFAYAMRPKHPNISIPALTVTLFDPQSEKFSDIATTAIPLEVSEASRVTSGDLVGSLPAAGSSEIKSRAEGIFQNITDPSVVRDESINVWAWSELVLGVWCLSGITIGITILYRKKSSDAGWQRRQQARRAASRRLTQAREALSRGQSQEALHQVRSAIVGLIADMGNRVTEGLTANDAAAALMSATVPAEDRVAVIGLLETIEAAEYGAGQSTDTANAIDTATALVTRITPYLERGV
ncbi:MAG: hypothetical protein JWM11_2846 [Planctomycetaceae bacterium]|nr:hypothetical protein [Planctomycetaceae bacterium]